jgi:YD repeat-containing protein
MELAMSICLDDVVDRCKQVPGSGNLPLSARGGKKSSFRVEARRCSRFNMCFLSCFASILVAAMSCIAGTAVAQQNGPGTFADGHHPAGPPDPAKVAQIWKVDPITGSVSINIPFLNVRPSSRGPFYPYSLQYNSGSTFALSTDMRPIACDAGGPDACPQKGFTWYSWYPPNPSAGTMTPPTPAPWVEVGTPTLRYSAVSVDVSEGSNSYTGQGQTTNCQIVGPYILTDGNGSHDLNLAIVNISGVPQGPCIQIDKTQSSSSDGSTLLSGWDLPAFVTYPDGTKFYGNAAPGSSSMAVEDSNGNYLTSSGTGESGTVTDSLGRPLYTVTDSSMAGTSSFTHPTDITTYTTGTPAHYTLTWGRTNFGFNFPRPTSDDVIGSSGYPGAVGPGPGTGSIEVLQSILLPDSTSYEFTYDTTYGVIRQINFPTGGYVRFTWGIRAVGDFSSSVNAMSSLVVTGVSISHDGSEDHWTYNCQDLASGKLTCEVTDPQENKTIYTGSGFGSNADPLADSGSPTFQETSRQISSGGTLVRTINTTYGGTGGAFTLPAMVTTTLNDAASGAPNQQQVKYTYDQYNNVIEKDESDFYLCPSGVCTPPGWLRKTLTTYYWSAHPAYRTAHIVDKPDTVMVTDGSGNPLSETQYDYDQFALTGSAGIQNHDDSGYPASFRGPRGNMTTESHCLVFRGGSCAQWATTTYHYDLTGQVVSVTDPCGNGTCSDMDSSQGAAHTTTYSYTDAYFNVSPSHPTNGFATTITRPQTASVSHVDSYSYYYSTGAVYQHTDENSNTTSYSYADPATGAADPFNRIGQITLPATPDGPAGGTNASGYQRYSYSDAANGFSVTQSALMTTSGSNALTKVTNYDELGRVKSTLLTSDPDGPVETDTTYDSNGRVYQVSNPHRSTSEPTYAQTIFNTYDALGRKTGQINPDGSTKSWSYAGNTVISTDENQNQWKQTSDGLGRLVYVLEPNGTSHAPSMQTSYSYDALGNLLSVSQCGGSCPSTGSVGRRFTYDAQSRLVQSFNPETGWTCYGSTGAAAPNGNNCTSGYDANGNLSLKTDARAVVTRYTYDALNRVLSKSYANDAAGTPSSCYQYDSGINSIGRLTRQWTQRYSAGACTSSSSGLLTARAITAYDPMGRVLSEQQSTLASQVGGASYPLTYSYDLAGNLYQSTNGSVSRPITFTNVFDSAGRLYTLTSSWTNNNVFPATLFTAQSATSTPCPDSLSYAYAASGALMNAQLGNTLTLNRAYDKRWRTTCEKDSSSGATITTPGSGSLTITGVEQSK